MAGRICACGKERDFKPVLAVCVMAEVFVFVDKAGNDVGWCVGFSLEEIH